MGGREVRHLLPPGKMVAAEAVRKDDRRPLAEHFVVDLRAVATKLHLRSNALRVQCPALTAPLGARPCAISAACAAVSMDWCSIACGVRPPTVTGLVADVAEVAACVAWSMHCAVHDVICAPPVEVAPRSTAIVVGDMAAAEALAGAPGGAMFSGRRTTYPLSGPRSANGALTFSRMASRIACWILSGVHTSLSGLSPGSARKVRARWSVKTFPAAERSRLLEDLAGLRIGDRDAVPDDGVLFAEAAGVGLLGQQQRHPALRVPLDGPAQPQPARDGEL